MMESESIALPLGDTPSMGWVVGIEPTHVGITILCLNHLTIPTILVNFVNCGVARLRPRSRAQARSARSSPVRLAPHKITCVSVFFCELRCCSASSSLTCTSTLRSLLTRAPCTSQNYLRICFLLRTAVLLGFVLAHVHKHAPLVPHPCALHFTKLPAYLFSFVNYSIIYALQMQSIYDIKLATKTRLELVTSSVTGWHSNQLNYLAISGGRYRARTYDPLLVRQMLSQLS